MKRIKETINLYDINCFLIIVGFPLFTMIVENSTASIVYRAVALLVAIVCLCKSRINISNVGYSKKYLFLLFYISIQLFISLFIGEYSDTIYIIPKYQAILFDIGIVAIPIIALASSMKYLHRRLLCSLLFLSLLFIIIKGDLNTLVADTMTDGRYSLNGRISTLTFGDNSAYLILLSASILFKEKIGGTKLRRLMVYSVLAVGIIAGVYGLAKAGSRGPFVGAIAGLLVLTMYISRKQREVMFFFLICLSFFGLFSLSTLEKFAPVLYERFYDTIESGDSSGRDELFVDALNKLSDNWALGTSPYVLEFKEFSSCHNVYLEMLVGCGVIIGAYFILTYLNYLKSLIVDRKFLRNIDSFGLFSIALLFFNSARGLSGIMLIANAIFGASIILSSYEKRLK